MTSYTQCYIYSTDKMPQRNLARKLKKKQRAKSIKWLAYLLKFSFSYEPVCTMFRTRSPSDGMIRVKVNTGLSLLLVDDLETVVVDEHVGRPSLKLIGRDGGFDGLDRRCNDRVKTFFVNRTLDCDVRKNTIGQAR